VRDGYLQRRRNLVYDGNPPEPAQPPSEPDADEHKAAPPPRADSRTSR
jgi:hypothetical protein